MSARRTVDVVGMTAQETTIWRGRKGLRTSQVRVVIEEEELRYVRHGSSRRST
jgi:hypothetical protein